MQLPPLTPGQLIKRYKRFLADVRLEDGTLITAHCPNTGAMTGCAEPGARVWLSTSDNPKRKYAHTWELVETADGVVSVNTGRANTLIAEALTGVLLPFAPLQTIRSEAAIPEGDGRFDFCLQNDAGVIWVEVKSVTLFVGEGVGAFPDAVSARALKHVEALQRRVDAGERGALVFCAQHCGVQSVRLADEIDPGYGAAVRQAVSQGVEVYALGCTTDLESFTVNRRLPLDVV